MPDQQTDASAGELVLAAAAAGAKEALGERLIAMYALGSLAHGGFSSIVSDVDLGLILQDPLRESDDAAIRALAESVRAGGTALHERLSVYWGTPASLSGRVAGGRFPALDRLDLIEQGRLLAGEDVRHVVARPSDPELLIAGAEFALEYLGGGPALRPAPAGLGSMSPADERTLDEIRSPMVLVARGPRRVTKVVLFPVRFLFTAATGRVGTNALAVEHYLADADAPARALASAALSWRLEPAEHDEVAAALLGRELIPLYVQYIEDHKTRLRTCGRPDLALRFEQWQARLLA